MPKSDDSEEKLSEHLNDLCMQLNVDPVAAKKAKESFFDIRKHYTLDGDPHHWIACALYVACRSSITPTVKSGKAVEGNCVSLTRLLRLSNISLIQFFTKIKNWMEMASMSTDFKERISQLERKFAVSTVLFRKFQPIFQEIFSGLTNEPLKSNTKSKKHRMQPCTTNALFEFSWCLYICVKGEFTNSADDLVDMYHILLSCLDFVYANAFMARRRDLINPQFKGLPSDWLSDDFQLPSQPPCIISTLCEIKDGLALEAATMKEYSWRPVIKNRRASSAGCEIKDGLALEAATMKEYSWRPVIKKFFEKGGLGLNHYKATYLLKGIWALRGYSWRPVIKKFFEKGRSSSRKGSVIPWHSDFRVMTSSRLASSAGCEIKDGLALEAATMKEYSWRPVIKKFFEKGVS
ncbi:retinoblastoma-like protein 1 [Phthorimaea operculella]|nr:retinoblastoma-like protein 1 [Phthorimaea operculella]